MHKAIHWGSFPTRSPISIASNRCDERFPCWPMVYLPPTVQVEKMSPPSPVNVPYTEVAFRNPRAVVHTSSKNAPQCRERSKGQDAEPPQLARLTRPAPECFLFVERDDVAHYSTFIAGIGQVRDNTVCLIGMG